MSEQEGDKERGREQWAVFYSEENDSEMRARKVCLGLFPEFLSKVIFPLTQMDSLGHSKLQAVFPCSHKLDKWEGSVSPLIVRNLNANQVPPKLSASTSCWVPSILSMVLSTYPVLNE